MKKLSKMIANKTCTAIEKHTFSVEGLSSSKKSGKNALFFGAIHGDEPCGPKALRKLVGQFSIGELRVLEGSITFVPVCNPKAFAQKVRYCEENLNRVFTHHADPKTYEAKLANELASAVDECDVLIDIHSTSASSAPFVFLDYQSEANRHLAEATGIPNIVTGWIELYKSIGKTDPQKPAYDTGRYAHEKGKVSVTIECGKHGSVSAERVAYRAAINVLRYFGIIGGKITTPKAVEQKVLRLDRVYFKDSTEDVLVKKWKNFEPVSKGKVIARREGGRILSSPYDGYIVMPKQNPSVGDEWFYIARPE